METIRFWYTFDDEDGDMSTSDIEVSLSNEDGVNLGEVCEAFEHFLSAAGFCAENLSEYFTD